MSPRIEYFAAADDETAARTLDADDASEAIDGSPRLDGGPVDPVVLLGSLEEFVADHSFDDQLADPESRRIVASRDGGGRTVIRIDDSLVAALNVLDPDGVPALAHRWATTGELDGVISAALLEEFIEQLSHLAKDAVETGHLYCLVEL